MPGWATTTWLVFLPLKLTLSKFLKLLILNICLSYPWLNLKRRFMQKIKIVAFWGVSSLYLLRIKMLRSLMQGKKVLSVRFGRYDQSFSNSSCSQEKISIRKTISNLLLSTKITTTNTISLFSQTKTINLARIPVSKQFKVFHFHVYHEFKSWTRFGT